MKYDEIEIKKDKNRGKPISAKITSSKFTLTITKIGYIENKATANNPLIIRNSFFALNKEIVLNCQL